MTAVNFLAATFQGGTRTLYSSPDGMAWSATTLTYSSSPGPVGYNPASKSFLVFESSNYPVRRIDQATGAVTTLGSQQAEAAACTGGVWAALSGNTVYRSTDDGATWTNLGDKGLYARNSSPRGAFAAANGVFLATQYASTAAAGTHVMRSTDGATWSDVGAVSPSGSPILDFAYNPTANVWLAVAQGGAIYRSLDNGLTWSSAGSAGGAAALAYGDGVFVAVCDNTNSKYSSDNGATWANFGALNSFTSTADGFAVVFYNGRFVAAENAAYPVVSKASSPLDTSAWTAEVNSGPTVSGGGLAATVVANRPPNAPTLTGPANNSTIDRGITQRFAWNFSDPDAGDSQSWFQLRYRLVGANTWTVVDGTTPNSYWDAAAGTFAAGDYEWQVATRDAQGAPSSDADLVFSPSSFFTAADAPAQPTITAPTSGATISNTATVAWSAPNQTAYRVRRVADNAGAANASVVYYDSDAVTNSVTRSVVLNFETNNRYEHIQVRIKNNGLWSQWADIRVQVSYTPPTTPSFSLLADNDAGSIGVAITNPAPGSGVPATSYNDVYVDDGNGEERKATMLAPNSTWTYWTPVALRDYSTAVRVVAVASNGTTASS